MSTAAHIPQIPVQTVPPPMLPVESETPSHKALSPLRKAAVLMITIGDEMARSMYQHLSEHELRLLTEEIASVRDVPPEVATGVLEEFHLLIETQQYMVHGGLEYATKLLVDTFGKQRAEDLLNQVKNAQEALHSDLAMLQEVDPHQLSKFLEGEHPQTVALVLAHLDPRRASQVLQQLAESQRVDSVRRLAEMQQFSPEMAQKVALVLHKRLDSLGDTHRKSYSGFKAVADLLNRLDTVAARAILEQIEGDDPQLAINIRNLMFTFEDLVTVPAASIRDLISQIDKKQLALALKGANAELRAHLFKALSSRAVEMLQEDMEVMGPVRAREVMQAQQEILTLARKLEAEGKLILATEKEDDMVI
ncbi:MAG TPA: flagellar motor switch protein FliG [Acidobacteriaceae bacterium]|nr:flagellar motor switch protein FliG [Acidobacteriaceae bacterium]